MSRPALVATILLAVLVAACTSGGATPSQQPSASPSPSALAEVGPAQWWVDPDALPLDPSSTVIRAVLRERDCASGQSPEGRVLPPVIEYGEAEVVITFEVGRREGDQDCQGNPEFPIEIELSEPLGDRAVVDGFDDRDATAPPA